MALRLFPPLFVGSVVVADTPALQHRVRASRGWPVCWGGCSAYLTAANRCFLAQMVIHTAIAFHLSAGILHQTDAGLMALLTSDSAAGSVTRRWCRQCCCSDALGWLYLTDRRAGGVGPERYCWYATAVFLGALSGHGQAAVYHRS
jgi:hypothetical protein